jgi:hypothetical protein
MLASLILPPFEGRKLDIVCIRGELPIGKTSGRANMTTMGRRLVGANRVILLPFLFFTSSMAIAQVYQPLRGSIERMDGQTLAVREPGGDAQNVKLADGVRVFTLKAASLADVKPGGLVGITTQPQVDGSQKAAEIYIFLDEPTHEPWMFPARRPVISSDEGTLTYIEGPVISNDGKAVVTKYKDSERKTPVPEDVRVVVVTPATVADIKAGQYCFIPNGRQVSTGMVAPTIIVGSNSVDFAM